MPFITKNSSERLNDDIKYDKRDPSTGEITEKGNGLEPIVLTSLDHLSFRAEDTDFSKYIWRGQPDPQRMCWNNQMPIFRVLTENLKDDTNWERFMRKYRIEGLGLKPRAIHYEPDIQDIRVEENPEDDRSFPLWVIEELITIGEFETALEERKVDLPSQVRLTKQQYTAIMKEIEKRRKAERPIEEEEKEAVGNVSSNTKRSKS